MLSAPASIPPTTVAAFTPRFTYEMPFVNSESGPWTIAIANGLDGVLVVTMSTPSRPTIRKTKISTAFSISTVTFSRTGQVVFAAETGDKSISKISVQLGRVVLTRSAGGDSIKDMAMSPDDKFVYVVTANYGDETSLRMVSNKSLTLHAGFSGLVYPGTVAVSYAGVLRRCHPWPRLRLGWGRPSASRLWGEAAPARP